MFFIKGDLRKYKIRINGIDTAEMKDSDPQVSELAHNTVEAILPIKGKIVKAELGKFDKYGRVLSKMSVATAEGDIDLTKWMIEKGIAKAYDGKTKNVFTTVRCCPAEGSDREHQAARSTELPQPSGAGICVIAEQSI